MARIASDPPKGKRTSFCTQGKLGSRGEGACEIRAQKLVQFSEEDEREGIPMTMDKEWKVDEGELIRTRTCGWSHPGCHPVVCVMFIFTDKDGKFV